MPKPFGFVKLKDSRIYDNQVTSGTIKLLEEAAADLQFQLSTDCDAIYFILPLGGVQIAKDKKESNPFTIVPKPQSGTRPRRGWVYGYAPALTVGTLHRASIVIQQQPQIETVAIAAIGSVSLSAGTVVGGTPLNNNKLKRAGTSGDLRVDLSTDNPAVTGFSPNPVTIANNSQESPAFTIYTVAGQAPAYGYIYGTADSGLIAEAELEVTE